MVANTFVVIVEQFADLYRITGTKDNFSDNLSHWDAIYFALADLTDANFDGADLARANLSYASLVGANLAGANLTGASVAGANLAGADLTGANVTGANLADADLTDVKGGPNTRTGPPR